MSITEVLQSKAEPSEKVATVADLVRAVRDNYGNSEAKITVPEIPTTEGLLPLSALSDETKVALALSEVKSILLQVIEDCNNTEGTNGEVAAEALIATNPVLVNLGEKVSYGVL
jgi:hypothetical protein